MFSSMKNYVFLFFGLGSAIGFGFVWVFVPETKGVPMEKMDELFGKSSGASDLETSALEANLATREEKPQTDFVETK